MDLVIGLLICIFILILVIHFISRLYVEFLGNKDIKKIKKIHGYYGCISIGSGPGKNNFNLDHVANSINLCVSPEDFRYDFRVLKIVKGHMLPGCVVIHAICPLSFAKNGYLYENRYNEKYAILLDKKDVDISSARYFVEKYFTIINHVKDITIFFKKRIFQNTIKEYSGQKLSDDLVKNWLDTNPYLKDFKETGQGKVIEEYFLSNISNLQKIKKYCEDEGYIYIPVIMPMSSYLKSYFSNDFLDEFLYQNVIKSLGNDFIDANEYEAFALDDVYTNGLFMKPKYSEEFTNMILDNTKEKMNLCVMRNVQI